DHRGVSLQPPGLSGWLVRRQSGSDGGGDPTTEGRRQGGGRTSGQDRVAAPATHSFGVRARGTRTPRGFARCEGRRWVPAPSKARTFATYLSDAILRHAWTCSPSTR